MLEPQRRKRDDAVMTDWAKPLWRHTLVDAVSRWRWRLMCRLGYHLMEGHWEQTPSGTRYLADECQTCDRTVVNPELEGEVVPSGGRVKTWDILFRKAPA